MDGLSSASVVTMSLRIWKVIKMDFGFSLLITHLYYYKYFLFLKKSNKEPPSYKINLHPFKSFYVQKAPIKQFMIT